MIPGSCGAGRCSPIQSWRRSRGISSVAIGSQSRGAVAGIKRPNLQLLFLCRVRRGDGVILRVNTVVTEFVAEGADADAEQFGGVGAVLARLFQCCEDVAFFPFGEGDQIIVVDSRNTSLGGRRGS